MPQLRRMRFRHLARLMDLVPYPRERELREAAGIGSLLLDIGGGTGRISRRLRSQYHHILVLDIERSMLRHAQARGLDVVLADSAHLPIKDKTIDFTLMVDALHHFPNQKGALLEAARALRPRGVLRVEEFDPSSAIGSLIEQAERLLRFGSTFRTSAELEQEVQDAGFSVVVRRPNAYEYVVSATKVQ